MNGWSRSVVKAETVRIAHKASVQWVNECRGCGRFSAATKLAEDKQPTRGDVQSLNRYRSRSKIRKDPSELWAICWRSVFTSAKEVVFVIICLFVSLLATLRKNFPTDLHEIFRVFKIMHNIYDPGGEYHPSSSIIQNLTLEVINTNYSITRFTTIHENILSLSA